MRLKTVPVSNGTNRKKTLESNVLNVILLQLFSQRSLDTLTMRNCLPTVHVNCSFYFYQFGTNFKNSLYRQLLCYYDYLLF